jgi:hypothetical protein
MVVARALQRARSSHPGLELDGSAVAGLPADVLMEFSDVVDLIVVADDEHRAPALPATVAALVSRTHCPVVVVPSGHPQAEQDARPVTVLVDEMGLPQTAIAFGLREAALRRTSLRVAQYWSDLHAQGPLTAETIADHQRQLDLQIADLRESNPELAVIGELLLQDSTQALRRVRSGSQLLITIRSSRHLAALIAPDDPRRCPVAVVPEQSGH